MLLSAPSVLLQLGLRDSTEPWFFTNDSTYQIEVAGDLVLHGHNPYGHDYRRSGLERFYTCDGTVSEQVRKREVALRHFAYFPGAVITAAAWRVLPDPFDDYRLLVLLATLAHARRRPVVPGAAGVAARCSARVLVANPIAIRSAWFGQNDAPSLLLPGAGLRARHAARATAGRRPAWPARCCSSSSPSWRCPSWRSCWSAVVTGRAELKRAAAVFVGVLAVGILPFLIADPGAFYDDTVRYGAGTYRIVGYGLSAMLFRLGVLDDRDGSYPFALWPCSLGAGHGLAAARAAALGGAVDRGPRLLDLDPVACCSSAGPSTTTTWCGR